MSRVLTRREADNFGGYGVEGATEFVGVIIAMRYKKIMYVSRNIR